MENTRDFTRHLNSLLEVLEKGKPEELEIKEWLDVIRKKDGISSASRNLYATYRQVDQLIGVLKSIQPMISDLKLKGSQSIYALSETPTISKIYSKSEAAEKLGMSRSTLYEKIKNGLISTSVDGKIPEDAIKKYLGG